MKTKYKILVALTLLVVFGLGVAAGVLGGRYAAHKKDRRTAAGRPHPPSHEDWAKELGLTESLEVGYRLSARGNVVRAAQRPHS